MTMRSKSYTYNMRKGVMLLGEKFECPQELDPTIASYLTNTPVFKDVDVDGGAAFRVYDSSRELVRQEVSERGIISAIHHSRGQDGRPRAEQEGTA